MKRFHVVTVALMLLAGVCLAQTKTGPAGRPLAANARPSVERGSVMGQTYVNKTLGFEISFPDTWQIAGDDFETNSRKYGFDLGLKAPASLPPTTKTKIDQAVRKVTILLNAYRSRPFYADNAIARLSIEDLSSNPRIKDAVDYFDAMRAMYAGMRLPADFKYSETQAERLGAMQFAFLDTSSAAGLKRMYATVRHGFAIQFTLSYTNSEDLQTFRRVMEQGNFALK